MEFRCPDILDAERGSWRADGQSPDENLPERLRRAENALRATRDYGRTLWTRLDQARHYLLEGVAGGEDSLQPTMLHGVDEWREWAELFAQVSSALAGASGDSGLGRSEAVLVARAHGIEVGPGRG